MDRADHDKEAGYHLAFAATLRTMASRLAQLAAPDNTAEWFTRFEQQTFDYVDRTKNPSMTPEQEKTAKDAAYNTLRLIFDPNGFEG